MNYWQHVLAALPTSGVFTLGLGIFLWLYLKRKTEADIADTYKRKEQERQAEHQRELEGWKAGYVKALDENRIRFAKLYDERAIATKEMYSRLIKMDTKIRACVFNIQFTDAVLAEKGLVVTKGSATDDMRIELYLEASDSIRAFNSYASECRILLGTQTSEMLAKTEEITTEIGLILSVLKDIEIHDKIAEHMPRLRTKIDELSKESTPQLIKQLESEFRKILGVDI
ncbi:MAG: hypothetical protein ACF8OB_08200 [Phycisphaeraceae bacterium JB051]